MFWIFILALTLTSYMAQNGKNTYPSVFCYQYLQNRDNITDIKESRNPRGRPLFVLCYKPAQSTSTTTTTTTKSLQSCPTLCDPIDSSPPGSPVPGILQARTLEWVAISFSSAWNWKVKGKWLSRVRFFMTPWTAAYQAPPSMGLSRQERVNYLAFTMVFVFLSVSGIHFYWNSSGDLC